MYIKNREQIDILINFEITSDPTNRGYSGADTEGKVTLLNSFYTKEVPNPLFGEEGEEEILLEEQPPRIYTILYKIAFAPNAIVKEDLERLGY
jgi:hypothetical protein